MTTITIVGFVITSVVSIVVAVVSTWVWENYLRDRITVRRLRSADHSDFAGLVELYQRLFPDDGTNYTLAEFLEFFAEMSDDDARGHHVVADNIILVARCRRQVAGFLACHFYPSRQKAIISYFGIDESIEARHGAAHSLLKKLKRTLEKRRHACDYLFFDLQGFDELTSRKEVSERKARPLLFRRSAKKLGLRAYLLQFPYMCPKVSLETGTREYPFSLMVVPIRATMPVPLPKPLVLEFLRFIFHDCYGDVYHVDDERFAAHQEHLATLIAQYDSSLPSEIGAC